MNLSVKAFLSAAVVSLGLSAPVAIAQTALCCASSHATGNTT